MRKDIVEIDENGIWVKDVSLYPVSFNCDIPVYSYPRFFTEIKPPTDNQPFYRAMWTGTEWIEDMTQEEIDALNSHPRELTDVEKLQIRQIAIEDAINFILEL